MAITHAARPTDWPVYWFAKLDKAVTEGDHEAAAEAQRELRRLGVRVNYGRPVASEDAGAITRRMTPAAPSRAGDASNHERG